MALEAGPGQKTASRYAGIPSWDLSLYRSWTPHSLRSRERGLELRCCRQSAVATLHGYGLDTVERSQTQRKIGRLAHSRHEPRLRTMSVRCPTSTFIIGSTTRSSSHALSVASARAFAFRRAACSFVSAAARWRATRSQQTRPPRSRAGRRDRLARAWHLHPASSADARAPAGFPLRGDWTFEAEWDGSARSSLRTGDSASAADG